MNPVEITAERAPISLQLAGDDLLLNGPIQGGLHDDLRALAGELMGNVDDSAEDLLFIQLVLYL